jgi:hypothetical protein
VPHTLLVGCRAGVINLFTMSDRLLVTLYGHLLATLDALGSFSADPLLLAELAIVGSSLHDLVYAFGRVDVLRQE